MGLPRLQSRLATSGTDVALWGAQRTIARVLVPEFRRTTLFRAAVVISALLVAQVVALLRATRIFTLLGIAPFWRRGTFEKGLTQTLRGSGGSGVLALSLWAADSGLARPAQLIGIYSTVGPKQADHDFLLRIVGSHHAS